MAAPFERSKFALTGGIIALLLGVCCSSTFASSGFETQGHETIDELPTPLPSPSLNVKAEVRGLIDAAADMKAQATEPGTEKMTSTALLEVATATSTDDAENDERDDTSAVPDREPPETALRLPGVSEEDQPRFRRQMYRTDI